MTLMTDFLYYIQHTNKHDFSRAMNFVQSLFCILSYFARKKQNDFGVKEKTKFIK